MEIFRKYREALNNNKKNVYIYDFFDFVRRKQSSFTCLKIRKHALCINEFATDGKYIRKSY